MIKMEGIQKATGFKKTESELFIALTNTDLPKSIDMLTANALVPLRGVKQVYARAFSLGEELSGQDFYALSENDTPLFISVSPKFGDGTFIINHRPIRPDDVASAVVGIKAEHDHTDTRKLLRKD